MFGIHFIFFLYLLRTNRNLYWMTDFFSIIIPVYNEEENIFTLIDQINKALPIQEYSYEIILVNDGSTDKTLENIKKVSSENHHLLTVDLYGNFGQSSALAAGIDHAKGEYIVTMDGDLQNDPEDIPFMLEKLIKEDWDLLAGVRANRRDGYMMRKFPSKLANFLIRWLTGIRLKDYGCTLKVFKSDIARGLGLYGELHRFIPVLAYLQGARITQVNVRHHPRRYGKSKYGINRTFKVLSDLTLMLFYKKYLQRPMHIFGTLGILVLLVGILINFYLVYLKILGQDIWGKPLLMLGIMLTLGGVQLVTVGILAEIMMRTYYESQQKKPYKVKRIIKGEVSI